MKRIKHPDDVEFGRRIKKLESMLIVSLLILKVLVVLLQLALLMRA